MKKFTLIQEKEEVKNIQKIKDSLNIKNADINVEESKRGNQLIFDIEILFSKDLKRLKSNAISKILEKLNGYITNLEYSEKGNKMVIKLITFQHLI